MMRFLSALFLVCFLVTTLAAGPVAGVEKPRLVFLLVLDQFRYEFLVRHRASFVPGGFNLLLEQGAVFANCHYPYAVTLTAPGHAVISTGSYPMQNGIIGNEWFDRASGSYTTADRDPAEKLLGAEVPSPGSSPHWLVGSAFADELRLATGGQGRVISIAPKARSAILPGGRGANAAYWFESNTLHAVSSTWYMKDLPEWVKQFNARDWAEPYAGKPWKPVDAPGGEAFTVFPAAQNAEEHKKLARAVADSAFITDIQFALAKAAVENERLGSGTATDMLAVSISATDFVGHDFGPDHPRTRDTVLRADRAIADFLRFLDSRIGLQNVWIAFSADHGVAPMPEVAREVRLDAGRIPEQAILDKVESRLTQLYGPPVAENKTEQWIQSYVVPHLYLNQELLRRRKVNPAEAAREAARAILELHAFSAVFTREDLAGCRPGSDLAGKVCLAYYPPRGGDLYLVFRPFWMYELRDNPHGTTHGTPYSYDTHVPLILVGSAFRQGTYYTPASPADLAVTLSAALGIDEPALASGQVLAGALVPAAPPSARGSSSVPAGAAPAAGSAPSRSAAQPGAARPRGVARPAVPAAAPAAHE